VILPYAVGTRVRVVIPDERDPDHDCHDESGVIVDIFEDDLGVLLGDPRSRFVYTISMDAGELGCRPFRHGEVEPVH
jgi:hypothetical protein